MKTMCAGILLLVSAWATPAGAQSQQLQQAKQLMMEGLRLHAPSAQVPPSLPEFSSLQSPGGTPQLPVPGQGQRGLAVAQDAINDIAAQAAEARAVNLDLVLPGVAAAVSEAASAAAQAAAAQIRTDVEKRKTAPTEPPTPPAPPAPERP